MITKSKIQVPGAGIYLILIPNEKKLFFTLGGLKG
jgi:hypothetical protein